MIGDEVKSMVKETLGMSSFITLWAIAAHNSIVNQLTVLTCGIQQGHHTFSQYSLSVSQVDRENTGISFDSASPMEPMN